MTLALTYYIVASKNIPYFIFYDKEKLKNI